MEMGHGRLALLGVFAFFVVTGGYWLYTERLLIGVSALLNAAFAVLVYRRLNDAPRAV
ncbi:hypothetical protein [Haloarcula amylovorans]|uniref:hypothetical protein n=1 Tax=Haloarcula amylovorans TaxID=2562280 RepID=UPI001430476A|nr:hypothetical protein [Halomicroarcula amylolytica]